MTQLRSDDSHRFVLCLVGLAIVAAPPLVQGPAVEPLTVRELWTTLGPEELPFSYVGGLTEGPDGGVFIADTRGVALYRFEPSSESFDVFERKGNGPGGLMTPTLLSATPEGRVALYDIGRRAILHYDGALRPIDTIHLPTTITNPKGFAYLDDGTFVIAGGSMGGAAFADEVADVHRFSFDGRLMDSYLPTSVGEFRSAVLHTAGGALSSLPAGGFLYSKSAPHQIVRFDADMNARVLAADEDVLEPIIERFTTEELVDGQRVRRHRWFYDQSRAVHLLTDGKVLNIITREYRNDSVWEVWDGSGDLEVRERIRRPYRPFGKTAAGDILATYAHPESTNPVVVALRMSRY